MSIHFHSLFLVVFDECKHYETLSDRQRAAGVHRGNTLKCDQKDLATPKWYRFTGAAGTQMPTSCVPQHYCGTHAPGWLSGSHPTRLGQIVKGKVCFHWSKSCCNWHASIQIKRCNGFYVYKLTRTPACWLRYCGNAGFGELKIVTNLMAVHWISTDFSRSRTNPYIYIEKVPTFHVSSLHTTSLRI